MSPEIAVISMGKWDDGRNSANRFNTWHYGHPRKVVVDMLGAAIDGQPSSPKRLRVAEGAERFRNYTVRKKIYRTGWEGTIEIRATADKEFRVTTPDD